MIDTVVSDQRGSDYNMKFERTMSGVSREAPMSGRSPDQHKKNRPAQRRAVTHSRMNQLLQPGRCG